MVKNKKNTRKSPNISFVKVLLYVVGLIFILIINMGLQPVITKYFGSINPIFTMSIGIIGLTLLVWLGFRKL